MLVDPMASFERISKTSIVLMNNVAESEGDTFLDAEQRKAFATACRAKLKNGKVRFKYGQALNFDMYTGLRMGELLALRWGDIDFDKKLVRVSAEALMAMDRNPKSPTFGMKILTRIPYTKTNRPRYVSLGGQAMIAAQNMFANRVEGSEYVVVNVNGELVRPCTISKMTENIYDLAGLKMRYGTNIHALRHTFASMCFAKGMPVRVVSELMGHSSVQITMDTYIHLINENNAVRVPELEDLE